ncbi:MAG: hypothetical protein ACE14P_03700 [Methanotrichaceae archaeon]
MGKLTISIPDDLEEKIKATGRQPSEIILDLIRDRFQEPSNPEAAPEARSAEGTQAQNLAKEQEIARHKAERAKFEQDLAKESEKLNAKIAKYEEKGKGKETLENVKAMEASIQDAISTHKETEKLVGQLEKTVHEADGLAAETRAVKAKTEERIEKTRAFMKES